MEHKRKKGELERLSELFLSYDEPKPEKRESPHTNMDQTKPYEELGRDRLRVEERVKIEREINYPDIPAAQPEIKRQLLKLIDEGYTIVGVKLKRWKETEEFARKVLTEEILSLRTSE